MFFTLKSSIKASMVSGLLLMLGLQANTASAVLNVQEGKARPSVGTARISWGGADSLAKAQAIMYNNIDTPSSNATFNEEDDYSPSWSRTTITPNYGTGVYSAGSKGAIVMDAVTGQVIYEKNADVARPIASLSKLMTAVIVAESNLDMNETITIDSLDFKTPKKSGSDRLRVGDQLNRAEVMLMMLMKSENPAAKALARTDPQGYDTFIAKMNAKARELGMTQTQYYDPSGLDKRNVASPRDLAILAKYAAKHNIISRFSTTPNRDFWVNNVNSGTSRTISAKSTNYMVRDGLYNLVLSKTGFINEAGKCLIVETNVNNRPAVVVLLGATDTKTRWNDAESILTNLKYRNAI